jgi:hypothetical protein
MQLPVQSPPVYRELLLNQFQLGEGGIEPSQSACDSLTGMAQQMCYALEYGISE